MAATCWPSLTHQSSSGPNLSRHGRNEVPKAARQQSLHVSAIPELLYMVFAWLCPHCRGDHRWPLWAYHDKQGYSRKRDACALFNLCLVSSWFRAVAQEVMYHTFDPCDPFVPPRYRTWEQRVEPFLRTILSRPDLARSVKVVCIEPALIAKLKFPSVLNAVQLSARALGLWSHGDNTKQDQDVQTYLPEFMRDVDLVNDVSKENKLNLWHRYLGPLARELFTILIALLPSLRHLRVESIICDLDLSPETANSLGLTELPIKTLDTGLPLQHLLALAPCIETMINRGLADYSWSSLPNVKSLVIDSIFMDSQTIQHGVSACMGHLSHFSYQGVDLQAAEVVRALDTPELHGTLESLHIDRRFQLDTSFARDSPEAIFSLNKFAALSHAAPYDPIYLRQHRL